MLTSLADPHVAASDSWQTQWLEGASSPFPVPVLDCQPITGQVKARTRDPRVAERFGELRHADGTDLVGGKPDGDQFATTCLFYPLANALRDGVLYKAEQMEDKWDIYLYSEILYFARSWTAQLVYTAEVDMSAERLAVNRVGYVPDLVDDGAMAVRAVDFLIKSHVLRLEAPAPIPAGMITDADQQIALTLFAQYGRWARYATHGDTVGLGVAPLRRA